MVYPFPARQGVGGGVCEVAACKFVDTIDKLVSEKRQAKPGGREKKWDADTMKRKQSNLLNSFKAFLKNDAVTSDRATAVVTALLIVAMQEMSGAHVHKAWTEALAHITASKAEVLQVP